MKTQKITKNLDNMGIVSVVIPIYNAEKFLDMSLQSLLRQTYPYWEAVLVNDGSTDNSLSLIRNYAAADSRFKVINKSNNGVASARNRGLDNINGSFVAFLDPDDMLYPQFLEIMLKTLLENKADMVACNFKSVAETATLDDYKCYSEYKTAICNRPLHHFLYRRHPKIRISCCNKLFRRELLANERFCEEFQVMAEDFYFSMTLFAKISTVAIIHEKLFAYRQNSASLTHRRISFAIADDHLLLLTKLVDFFTDKCEPRILKKLRRRLSKIAYQFCCMQPYSEQGISYFDFWQRYYPKIASLHSAGIFDKNGLSLPNQICFKQFIRGELNLYEKYLERWQKLRNLFKLFGRKQGR